MSALSERDVQLPAAELIESATHELLNGQPNWGAIMTISDRINQHPAQAPAMLAALKKRLSHKKHSIGLLAIIVLESIVKNSSGTLLPLIATPGFMDDIVALLPKQIRDPNHKGFFNSLKDYTRDIQACERFDKILLSIETWARTFGARFPVFADTYRTLQRAGCRFPSAERDERAPVVTPPPSAQVAQEREEARRRSLAELERATRDKEAHKEYARRQELSQMVLRFRDADARAAVEMCSLFTDTLTQTNPGENLARNELVQQIWSALKPCARKLQDRLAALAAGSTGNEQVLAEVLQANDVCMEAAIYYQGLENGTLKRRVAAEPPPPVAAIEPESTSSSSADISTTGSRSRKSSSAAAPPEKKSVPLLQPPPGSSSSSASSSSSIRKRSSAEHAAAPQSQVHVAQPSLDLLFASPSPPAADSSREGVPHLPSEPCLAPTILPIAMPVAYPSMPPQQPARSPNKSAFALAPPPAAVANSEFFSSSAAPARPAALFVASPAAPVQATPFDSPDPPDPWLALATRDTPPAASASSSSHAPPAARKQNVAEQFDLLQF